MRLFKCNEHVKNDDTKHHLISNLTDAIYKIAKYNVDPSIAMQGLIQYRLIGPTYLQVPCRSDDVNNNIRNRKLRIQHFNKKQWNQLLNLLELEQNKHDAQEKRQSNRILNSLNDDNNNDNPSAIGNVSGFINDATINPHNMPVDINSVVNNVLNVKYYGDDDCRSIKNRLKISINKAKRGQWKV